MAVNDSNRRDRRRTYREHFNTLWDERTRDKNRLLFNILLTFGSLVVRGIGKHRPGKHAGRNENCSAFRNRRLHKHKLHPGSCRVQIIETMAMAFPHEKQERQWLLPLPLRPNPNLRNLKVLR